MPNLKIYDIFISHAWRYSDDYNHLVKLLNEASNFKNFKWRNYSDPRHDPIIDPNSEVGRKRMIKELR
jgi:hypothetical protein